MYAVIETGGKQYRVQNGDRISVEKLNVEDGGKVVFDKDVLPVIVRIQHFCVATQHGISQRSHLQSEVFKTFFKNGSANTTGFLLWVRGNNYLQNSGRAHIVEGGEEHNPSEPEKNVCLL